MALLTFPHCGRTYVCEDTVGITDIRQARSAYSFALEFGQQQASAYTSAWNMRAGYSVGSNFQAMFDEPIVGFTNASNFIKQSTPYYSRIPFELIDSHDAAAITLGFRFMDLDETVLLQSATGEGRRGQRVSISITNLANNVTEAVLDIYYDRPYYLANVTTAYSGNPYIDLSNNSATAGFSANGLDRDAHNVITILKALPASLRQINRAAAASLTVSYEFPKNGSGGTWTNLNGIITAELNEKNHPLSGAPMAFCGINEVDLRTYRTSSWTQGAAAATATNSRAYPLTPIPAFPLMGDTYTAGVHNSLNAYATSIEALGYVAANAIGANRGGFIRPLAGHSYRFTDQFQRLTFYGEIPEGATGWVLLAYVKTENFGGLNETVRFRINANGFETLATTSTTSSGSTAARWYYATGSLAALVNTPTNGQVNRCNIILEVEKTAYSTRTEPRFYWDGVYSYILKFF